MSRQVEPEDEELRRQLDAAFANTGPRRGFQDALWARIQPARRRGGLTRLWDRAPMDALVAIGALAVIVGLVFGVTRLGHGSSGASTATSAPAASQGAVPGGAAAPGARQPEITDQVPAQFGTIPAPALTEESFASTPGGPAVYLGPARLTIVTRPPSVASRVPVYRFAVPAGLGNGTVLATPPPLPGDATSSSYPTRDGATAARDALTVPPVSAAAALDPTPNVTLTKASIVYVVVVEGSTGYLQPAYLFSGQFTAGGTLYEKRVLVPALAASQLRSAAG